MRLSSYGSPFARGVRHPHGVELDRDAALALEVERVEHLLLHLTLLQRPGRLDQAVGQRGLAVVDVRDDAEVANMVELQNSGLVASAVQVVGKRARRAPGPFARE